MARVSYLEKRLDSSPILVYRWSIKCQREEQPEDIIRSIENVNSLLMHESYIVACFFFHLGRLFHQVIMHTVPRGIPATFVRSLICVRCLARQKLLGQTQLFIQGFYWLESEYV